MKKFLAVLALVGVLASCKDKKKADTPPATDDTATVKTTDPVTPPVETTGVPTFNDADVTAYVKAYEDYIAVYRKAAESKDMSKMAELGTLGQDLATKGTAAAQKLASNPEDAKKLADYMTAKSAEIMELTKKLTGQ